VVAGIMPFANDNRVSLPTRWQRKAKTVLSVYVDVGLSLQWFLRCSARWLTRLLPARRSMGLLPWAHRTKGQNSK
jgi:hypothetical protein